MTAAVRVGDGEAKMIPGCLVVTDSCRSLGAWRELDAQARGGA